MTPKARPHHLWSRFFVVALLLLLILAALPAAAQDGAVTPIAVEVTGEQSITLNEIKPATVSPLEPRARFVLNVTGPTSAVVQALATTPGLAPAFQVFDPSGVLILSADNNANMNIVQAPVNLPNAGDYRLEVYDRGGAAGDLVIAVQPGLPQLPPVGLLPGQLVEGTVGSVNHLQVYLFNALPSQALLLHVNGTLPMPAPVVTLKDAISGEPLALMSLELSGVRYRIPMGAASYRVEVAYGGSPAQEPYTVCLETEDGTTPCTSVSPQPAATATATVPGPLPTSTTPPIPPSSACLVRASGGSAVNVRTGPDLIYPIVGILSGSTSAPVIGRSFDGSWWQINFGGSIAWVSAAFTTTEGSCGSVPVAAAPPTPLPAATATATTVPPTGVPPTATATATPTLVPTATSTPDGDGPFFPIDPGIIITLGPLFPTPTSTSFFFPIDPGVIVTLNPGILKADLDVTAVITPGVLPPGGVPVTVNVTNNGIAAAGPFEVKVDVGPFSGTTVVPGLAAGLSTSTNVVVFVPLPGAHVVSATVDSAGAINESDEGNNSGVSAVTILP